MEHAAIACTNIIFVCTTCGTHSIVLGLDGLALYTMTARQGQIQVANVVVIQHKEKKKKKRTG